ncbi:DUF1127 domain-containing protein [Bradyrhizobium sp. CCGB20]|uniref:DUF1127 domain-containing protein n=1 Tax=Bradyrhizobium sp. CCGB20 TaxID=2949633 RepID=UPI0020B26B25|nr:DUF1127 domain-containing protein [Bradyrhizobium sp. CCGB20]MCP3397860.1 DUF1127 domain-containing protein [Bradyrhizobium sp. CCGB20]
MKTHSRNVVRVVPDAMARERRGRFAWSDGRGVAGRRTDCTASQRLVDQGLADQGLADIGSRPAAPAAQPDREVSKFWSMVFALIEGFALYGAALHPTAAMPVHAILEARRHWQPRPEAGAPVAPVRNSGSDGAESNVVELDRVRPFNVQRERRWRWLRSAGGTLTDLLSHSRREREIDRAVAALAKLDDQTLRDLGIQSRSDIEWTVRYCHDC